MPRRLFPRALLVILPVVGLTTWVSFKTVHPGSLPMDAQADVLIVFGSPADMAGQPLPMQTWRVEEAVREYQRGKACHLLFTGGKAGNFYIESKVMAEEAVRMGLPADALLTEDQANTTIENVRNITPILKQHGWTRAEMISSPEHLPRIAVLMRDASFDWRLHAAPTPGRNPIHTAMAYAEEAVATLLLRVFGPAAEPFLHAFATCEHWIGFFPKWLLWHVHQSARSSSSVEGHTSTTPKL